MLAFRGEEMQGKHPGNGAERLEKLPKPEVEPLLQEPGAARGGGGVDSIAFQLLRVR